jgi:hypothetical protein
MAAAYVNLLLEQGTTFSTTITMDDVYGNAYDLNGYTASSQIRKSYYSANPTATFTASINNSSATITLSLTSTQTANIAPGRYVYDCIISNNNTTTRILEGVVDVSPSVTK